MIDIYLFIKLTSSSHCRVCTHHAKNQLHTVKEKQSSRKRRKTEKKIYIYIGFMDLEKTYFRVNREALWQVLGMYDVGGKFLNGIKSIC